jgi:hypothetical protein
MVGVKDEEAAEAVGRRKVCGSIVRSSTSVENDVRRGGMMEGLQLYVLLAELLVSSQPTFELEN